MDLKIIIGWWGFFPGDSLPGLYCNCFWIHVTVVVTVCFRSRSMYTVNWLVVCLAAKYTHCPEHVLWFTKGLYAVAKPVHYLRSPLLIVDIDTDTSASVVPHSCFPWFSSPLMFPSSPVSFSLGECTKELISSRLMCIVALWTSYWQLPSGREQQVPNATLLNQP